MPTARNEVLKSLFPEQAETIEGVFHQEPAPEGPSAEYHGELRYVNLGPQKLAWLLENGDLPEPERQAVLTARQWWDRRSPALSGGIEMGEPDRGDPREARVISTLAEAIDSKSRERTRKVPSLSVKGRGGGGRGDVIDVGDLLAGGEPPEPESDDDWF